MYNTENYIVWRGKGKLRESERRDYYDNADEQLWWLPQGDGEDK